jgi:hypothetical protein
MTPIPRAPSMGIVHNQIKRYCWGSLEGHRLNKLKSLEFDGAESPGVRFTV